MSFGAPHYLLLLLLVPALVVFYLWAFRRKDALLARFAASPSLRRLFKSVSRPRQRGKAALLIASAGLTALALSGPRWGFHWEEIVSRGRDVVVAVDVSKSMLAEDVAPSRLERAKRKVSDLLKLLQGDRVGLVAFAGRAHLRCPLTLDYGAVETLLQSLDTEAISVPGTALGDAIDRAAEAFGDTRGARAVVLITDGESFDGDPVLAATRAKERGIQVYAIGIGKDGGAPLRLPDGGFKKDSSGEVVLTRLDEKTLQNVTGKAGGTYARAALGDDDIQALYAHFQGIGEDRELRGGREKRHVERFQWPVLFALICLLVEILVTEAPGEKRAPSERIAGVFSRLRARFPGRRSGASAALVLAALAAPLPAWGASAGALAARGAEAYRKGEYEEALKHYLEAQVEDPASPAIRYDLANTYYKLGRYPEAAKLFEDASRERDQDIAARSRYNLGNALYRAGKLEEAARQYEETLRATPADEDAKHNLEVVKRAIQKQKEQKQQPSDQQGKPDDKQKQDQQQQPKAGDQQQSKGKEQQPSPSDDQRQSKGGDQQAQENRGEQHAPEPGEKDQSKTGEEKDQNEKQAKIEPSDPGKAGDDKPAPGEMAKKEAMTKEEAENWLSRLREGKKREQGRARGERRTRVEKDW